MIQRAILSLVFSAVLVMPAFAHEGVKNPAVMARMEGMKAMGAASKALGQMQKGARPFDAAAAQEALRTLAKEAVAVEDLFAAEETDPLSEALPIIWAEYEIFLTEAKTLATVTEGASVARQEDIEPLMRQISQTCRSCHKRYRE